MRYRRCHPCVLALALCTALAACKKEEAPPPPPPAPAAPAAQAPAAAPFAVSLVELGNQIGTDKRVSEPRAVFAASDTIYAAIVTNGSAPSVTLKARWLYEDGQVVNESEQVIAPTGPAVTEFHIAKPSGWPVGKYKVEIAANGAPVGSKEFEVR
jgi:hypothetical protein